MLLCGAGFFGLLLSCAAQAQAVRPPAGQAATAQSPAESPAVALHARYQTYAAGIQVAEVEAGFSLGPWSYQMSLRFHTTGMVGLFLRGHQFDTAYGGWRGTQAAPSRFVGKGLWHGEDRLTGIDYRQGKPILRDLVPPNVAEREPVPETMQANTIDTVSAIAQLIHVVGETGRCETTLRTYDGRRAIELQARTVGEETLEPTVRSSFAGKALRCDFSGHMLAGFKFGDNRESDSKPMHGSAWLAPMAPNEPPLPVRMTFETKWFGDAVMYLTDVGPGPDIATASRK